MNNKQKIKQIERDFPYLNGKWAVITKGLLIKICNTRDKAQIFAYENIPNGQIGSVSELGKKVITRRIRI